MTSPNEPSRKTLSTHILPTAGNMIGVSATLVGLVKIAEAHIGPSHVDEYAALTTVVFLVSAFSSYVAMRHAERRRLSSRCELIADQTFLLGLISLTAIVIFFAYEII
ncbi:MAG: hypothetical protein EKK40_02160 [Bradyrhizobiaceae bacterium]|nr:MAG: hypothetical protein EKK40_02160 [Bradyrhizobiaceae bacterium]